jgi:hypothetical protein
VMGVMTQPSTRRQTKISNPARVGPQLGRV